MLILTKKFKIYVDFDGVIKDTHKALFDDYKKLNSQGEYVSDTEHVIKKDWIYVLEKSPIINNAIKIVNELDDPSAVCTRVHSLDTTSSKNKFIRLASRARGNFSLNTPAL